MIIINYYIIIINILGFIICFVDKHRAIKNRYRISERVLFMIIFIGGCFGFALGMVLFHHKTRKKKFIISIFLSMIIYLFFLELL